MSKQNPFFTIVIPALNEEKFLPGLLKDLNKQSETDFEIIVVDGKSEDKTVEVARKTSAKSPKILSAKIRNVSFQRNLGAKQASAEWIIFFDADNRLLPNYLKTIKNNIIDCDVDSFTTHIRPDTKNAGDIAIAQLSNVGITLSNIVKNPTAFGAAIGVRKNVFEEIGGFDETISYQEDVDFVRRVCSSGYIFKVFKKPQIIYSFRRFRKEGTLNLIRKFAKLNLNSFTNFPEMIEKDYPMLGGTYYDTLEKQPLVFDFIKIRENIKRLSNEQKQKFRTMIQNLLED